MVENEIEDDEEAGPELPPDFEEDVPDDEEGRFFGGGMEQKTAQAMEYIDQQEEDEAAPEKFDSAWVRRFALNFEKKISKNAELRAKFENDPQKYVGIYGTRNVHSSHADYIAGSWLPRPISMVRSKDCRFCPSIQSSMRSLPRWAVSGP